jgi:4-carboxymuconolactone decarboxylase
MDNGLSAEEAGEVVAQAAFYAGWPNAFTAAPVVPICALCPAAINALTVTRLLSRGVSAGRCQRSRNSGSAESLPAASPTLLPLNEQVEKQRADTVEKNVGPILASKMALATLTADIALGQPA